MFSIFFSFINLELFGEECPQAKELDKLPHPLLPSFVLFFELGPLEEHCMVPLLGLQGPFSVQLMSHK